MPVNCTGSQYVYVSDDTLFNTITSAVTYMCWVKLTALPTAGTGGAFSFIGRNFNAGGTYSWEFGVLTTGRPVAEVTTNSGMVDSTSTFTMTTGTWYHCAATWDSTSQTTKIYMNGALSSSTSVPGTTISNTASSQFSIGVNIGVGNTGATQFLNGLIEDVRVYNRLLSANEILTISSLYGQDYITNNLLIRYMLNEGASGTNVVVANIKDSSINKVALTNMVGTPTYNISDNCSFTRQSI